MGIGGLLFLNMSPLDGGGGVAGGGNDAHHIYIDSGLDQHSSCSFIDTLIK